MWFCSIKFCYSNCSISNFIQLGRTSSETYLTQVSSQCNKYIIKMVPWRQRKCGHKLCITLYVRYKIFTMMESLFFIS